MATKSSNRELHDPSTGQIIWNKHQDWETGHDRRAPRPYYMTTTEARSAFGDRQLSVSNGYALSSSSGDFNNAYAKAYAKLTDSLQDSSSWGTNAAEFHQSISMIAGRATQLLRFTNAIKKLDVIGAAKALGVKPIKKRHIKSASNLWLEYHFGWDPLVKDIGSAVDTLTQKPFPKTIRGRAAGSQDLSASTSDSSGSYRLKLLVKCKVMIQVRVTVSNQNLANANALGLVNPAVVAWDLVPFSFVVDWFSNVGQVLGSFSTFVGYEVTNGFTTTYQTYTMSESQTYTRPDYKPYEYGSSTVGARMTRTLGTPSHPPLVIKPFSGFSPVRGATAIALLVQKLKSL